MSPSSSPFDILVLSDLHDVPGHAGAVVAGRGGAQLSGALLLRKCLQRLRHLGVQPGLLVLLGDLVEDGRAEGAEAALAAIAEEARKANLPVLAAAGNHDADRPRHCRVFGCEPGLHEVGGYGFLLFNDDYASDDTATRPESALALIRRAAAVHPELPLVALQHNPLHPRIDDPYPYMPANTETIRAAYEQAGVVLSLSGHYHAGQPAHPHNGVTYYTVPAACEPPFRFAHVRLNGRAVEIREHALRMDAPGLVDVHCHTQYSYCGTTVTAQEDIEISRLLGLAGVCIVDHAFQLYFPSDEAWSWRWQVDPGMVEKAWAEGRGRMPEYRRFTQSLRSDFVRSGVEVDVRSDGSLLLAEEDWDDWDIIVGAVHAIDGSTKGGATQAEAERLFLRDTESLLQHPIDVLAHPFRYFRRSGLSRPTHLYGAVADLLAQSGVAVEVNFHVNEPDPRFVAECLSRGVKVALGTDSHELAEVGEFVPHLNVLREAGVTSGQLPSVLFPGQVRVA